ncbi:MAG: bacillithiol system redox-active protein YtxJ [Salinibacter sp.]
MPDNPFLTLESTTDWTDALTHSEDRQILVFKHSSTCSISAKAEREMRSLAEETNVPVYQVVVQENRAVSDEIADTLNVRHESPQALLVDNGESVYDTSHLNVTEDTLRTELHRTLAE